MNNREKRFASGHVIAVMLVTGLALGPSQWADARAVRVDFDAAPFPNNGGGWPDAFDDGLDARQGPAFGTLAFGLNIGGSTYNTFCLGGLGFVGFQDAAATSCPGTLPAAYSSAVFAPLFDENLVSIFDGFATSQGSVSYSVGFVDLVAPFVEADAVTAMRFFWNDLTTTGDENRIFQMFVYDTGGGNGDFDLEFAYGQANDTAYATGAQFITVNNQDIVTGTGPFGPATDYFFQFRGGQLTGRDPPTQPPPVSVPEPSSVLLLLAGLGALAFTRRRRAA